ncbi:MAG: hypothetical protein A2Z99_14940 [Treponema sp. GWB1_62_6]|nr:MAG: hypothetical protein A2Y36_03360 [Treponema sp. GWA1_62_8]OHE63211.1 MAG: hypothetical protein A2001_09370 [Treponema sp. GWC1_61_84]OHE72362.1 MAG: hypothetical protein A2Z99_14940 [Treponema sp. GWB1_62_6]OHE75292.1 MAG: hypothetical protein A2413_06260 [Treponema sp. RIFOXYC1_FULL_61_9]HCM28308.1 hypothetical protein [Treponema sp.]
MHRSIAFALFLVSAMVSFAADSEGGRASVRASAGVAGVGLLPNGDALHAAGPAATAGLSMPVFGPVRLGFNVGAAVLLGEAPSSPSPFGIYNATIGYEFENGMKVDIGFPALPSIALTVEKYVFSLGIFPFYLTSGGATDFYLLCGKEFDLE